MSKKHQIVSYGKPGTLERHTSQKPVPPEMKEKQILLIVYT